jgi:hypothetical protein
MLSPLFSPGLPVAQRGQTDHVDIILIVALIAAGREGRADRVAADDR